MDKDQLGLLVTFAILAVAVGIAVYLRRLDRQDRKPVAPQRHELRFDDTALRDRVMKRRGTVAPPMPHILPSQMTGRKRERPPER